MPTWPQFTYVLRTEREPETLVAAARSAIRDVAPTLAVRNVRTMDDVLSAAVAPARWSTTLLGIFAGVALAIAVLGVFGVLSFLVTQRTRELGIRIALGGTPAQVRRMVMARGLSLVLIGAVLGLGGASLLTHFMSSLLYGITATDPSTFIGVSVVIFAAALGASYLPARRATRVDPLIALRAE
jgi:ABC-type antimicrobial peptide transport system permease subunit